jgi:hypothetical protein
MANPLTLFVPILREEIMRPSIPDLLSPNRFLICPSDQIERGTSRSPLNNSR